MLGSPGWRVFFAAMLLMGVFAVLRAEGATVSASAPDMVVMQGVLPSASVAEDVQAERPACFWSHVENGRHAEVGQAIVGKATASLHWEAADYHTLRTDRLSLAPISERAFHMLKFQGSGVRAHMLT